MRALAKNASDIITGRETNVVKCVTDVYGHLSHDTKKLDSDYLSFAMFTIHFK